MLWRKRKQGKDSERIRGRDTENREKQLDMERQMGTETDRGMLMTETERETRRRTERRDFHISLHNMHLNTSNSIYGALAMCKHVLNTFMRMVVFDSHNHPMR